MAADPVFIDTNVLVAASVRAHPSHGVASAYLARLEADGAPACISGQVCREFLVVLTRQPVEGRSFSPPTRRSRRWAPGCPPAWCSRRTKLFSAS
jgi:predicted nucleic acid-binding protein